jgi:hypothetical protein
VAFGDISGKTVPLTCVEMLRDMRVIGSFAFTGPGRATNFHFTG